MRGTSQMGRWRVLIGSKSFGKSIPEHIRRLEEGGCDVVPNQLGRAYRAAELLEALESIDAIITGTDELTAEVINAAPKLKVIAKHGVGLDNIDLQAARQRGIAVGATLGAVHDSVADLTLSLMLAVARGIVPAHAAAVRGEWKGFMGMELRGKVLGIVGLGRIGKEVCHRAQAFGMQIIAHDVYPDREFAERHGVRFAVLEELLRSSDIVTLHAGLAQVGQPLIGAQELSLMKAGAILINTGRGHLVDEAALAEALGRGRLAGAGLDVFAAEPPKDSPILKLDNVVLTPHMAGDTWDARRGLGEMTVENILRVMRGQRPLCPVD